MKREGYPWKLFWILYGLALFGVLCVIPYLKSLLEHMPLDKPLPFSLPLLLVLSFLQSAVLMGIATAAGLFLARKIGKGAPLLKASLAGEKVGPKFLAALRSALPAGFLVGLVLLLLMNFVFIPLEPRLKAVLVSNVPIWQKFLASFYGGICEEILMRLLLLSLLAWVLSKIGRAHNDGPGARAFWIANVILAVVFGLGHLGTASLMLPVGPLVVSAALVLNGIASITFGYLYWTRGLEAAMLAHFSADIVFHVVGSALLRA